jgi:arsenate reductase
MKATIYHNPLCGTSRKTLEILQDSGADLSVVEYLKSPPSAAELARLYARAGLSPREGLRMKEPAAQALVERGAGDHEILAAMVRDPILIERPLVETEKGALLCRPQDRVREIL